MFRALPWATRTPIWIASLATSTKFCSVLRPAVDVPTREEFKRLCLKALSDKKDTMKLDHIMEDVMFAFDWWALLKPHLSSTFKNYGSTGPVHVFRFQRRPGRDRTTPHVSF